MLKPLLPAVAIVASLTAPTAHAEVLHRWQAGAIHYIRFQQQTDYTLMQAKAKDQAGYERWTLDTRLTVKSIDDKSVATVEVEYLALRYSSKQDTATFEYNSNTQPFDPAKPADLPPQAQAYARIVGERCEIRLRPTGEVVEVINADDLVKRIAAGRAPIESALRPLIGSSAMAASWNAVLWFGTAADPTPAQWSVTMTLPALGGGATTLTRTMSAKPDSKSDTKIDPQATPLTFKDTYTLSPSTTEGGPKISLTKGQGEGTITFNTAAGHIASLNRSVALEIAIDDAKRSFKQTLTTRQSVNHARKPLGNFEPWDAPAVPPAPTTPPAPIAPAPDKK